MSKTQSKDDREEERGEDEEEEEEEEPKVTMRAICAGSPNVSRVFIYNSLDGIAFSVWNVSVVQLLIYRISGNSNGAVGWVSGVTGASQVFAALVGSYFADKGKREAITQMGALSGFIAVVLSVLAAYFETISLFYCSAVLWGYYMGFSYPASEALFADSVASGQRTAIYSYKWAVGTISYVFGYSINMILFYALGNHWHNSTIKIVVFCGLSLNPLSFIALLSVRDKHSLGKESEGLLQGGGGDKKKQKEKESGGTSAQYGTNTSSSSKASEGESVVKVISGKSLHNEEDTEYGDDSVKMNTKKKDEEDEEGDGTNKNIDWNQQWLCFSTKHVPYMLVSADFISALGAGMTIRFFPLFFINIYDVNPAVLNLCYVITMIVTSATATFIQKLAKTKMGRVPSMMMVRILGASALYYMAVAKNHNGDAMMGLMLGVWIFRNSMMNSPLGLSRSVIMDHVPKKQRTKWNAVESFSSFTWAGSAVIGGYLVDAHGYKFTFGITATCQIIGALIIFPAVFLTRKIDLAGVAKLEKEKEKQRK